MEINYFNKKENKNINVLALSLYGPLAASTRYRILQFIPKLKEYNINIDVNYLLNDEYLKSRYLNTKLPIIEILISYINRIRLLIANQKKYDLLFVYGELFPLFPNWLEDMLINRPYIYDLDDAFYLKYNNLCKGIFNIFLKNKFIKFMKKASLINAGNFYLLKYAIVYNNNAIYFPTVVNTKVYLPLYNKRINKLQFTIGWIGSPSTGKYLEELILPLSIIGKECNVRFIVIGSKCPVIPNICIEEHSWDEKNEIELINSFDVGVMPLHDDEWTRGKCGFKLIQYMSCAIPVVATSVGSNIDVVGKNCGILVSNSVEWCNALRLLRDDFELRNQMGRAGRNYIENYYSMKKQVPLLAYSILSVINK